MKLWIRLDVAIRSDPNVAELAARLNLRRPEAVGLCTLVWAGIAEHRPSGDLTGIPISAIEDWGGWVPRKGFPAGAFGSAFLELFTEKQPDDATTIAASGWLKRQGALVALAEKDRNRKPRKSPKDSTENPGKSTPTERNGTEQNQKPTTARVRERLLEADRIAFDDLISNSPNPDSWAIEIEAMLEGMHPPKVSPAQMGRGIRDLIANGKHKHPNIRQLRRYIEGAVTEKPTAFAPPVRARAERLYTELPRHGFTQNRPLDAHLARAKELAERNVIADLAQFTRELEALLPLSWLRDAKESDREKSIARIAAAIAPLQNGMAA